MNDLAEPVELEPLNEAKTKSDDNNWIDRCLVISFKWLKTTSINKIVLFFSLTAISWLILLILFGKQALPGGILFSLIALFLLAHTLGYLLEKVYLPSLLGMLLAGIVVKNVPLINVIGLNIDSQTSSAIRNIAFCVILCRAGLFLDINVLVSLKWKILKYSILPCLCEALFFGLIAHFMLSIPFMWSFLLGFIVCGVSPAVVVPFMIEMQELGYGVGKALPSLVIASSCIDNIVAIIGHNLFLGMIFNTGELWWTIVQCPIQILLGLAYGLIVGTLLSLVRLDHIVNIYSFIYYLNKINSNINFIFKISKNSLRFAFLFGISLLALLGSKKINYTSKKKKSFSFILLI